MKTQPRRPQSPSKEPDFTTPPDTWDENKSLTSDPEKLEGATAEELEEKRAALVESLNILDSYLLGFYHDLKDECEEDDLPWS